MNRHYLLLLSLAFAFHVPLLAFAEESEEGIITDRPDFTEAAVTVKKGELQVEAGGTAQWPKSGEIFSLPEALFRYGVTDTAELRFLVPDYIWQREDGKRTDGLGDIYVGTKLQLGPLANGDNVSLIPALNLPTGKDDLSTGTVDPELKLCYSRKLSENWTLSMMGYGLWTTINDDRAIAYQQTASFERELPMDFAVFFEYAGIFAEQTAAHQVAHTGLVYAMSLDSQADIHGGLSVNGDDQNPFVGVGYSFRFR